MKSNQNLSYIYQPLKRLKETQDCQAFKTPAPTVCLLLLW